MQWILLKCLNVRPSKKFICLHKNIIILRCSQRSNSSSLTDGQSNLRISEAHCALNVSGFDLLISARGTTDWGQIIGCFFEPWWNLRMRIITLLKEYIFCPVLPSARGRREDAGGYNYHTEPIYRMSTNHRWIERVTITLLTAVLKVLRMKTMYSER